MLLVVFLSSSCRKDNLNDVASKPLVALPPAGYKLVWADEFNGRTLDLEKWEYRYLGPRRAAFNSKESVTIDTNIHALVINTFSRNDSVFTGMIGTMKKMEAKYGYFETSIRVESIFPNYWPAFWLQSDNYGKLLDPKEDGMEIDIFEFIGGDPYRVDHYLHWNGYGANHQQAYSVTTSKTPFNDNKFHQFALEWTPDYYRYFVDGHLVWEFNGPISQTKQYMILSTEVSDKNVFKEHVGAKGGTKFEVDYVRVYSKDSLISGK